MLLLLHYISFIFVKAANPASNEAYVKYSLYMLNDVSSASAILILFTVNRHKNWDVSENRAHT
jgi:hypothetical protein